MFTLVDLILLIYMVFQKFMNCYLSLSIFLFTLLFTLLLFLFSLKYVRKDLPSKHFLFSKTSSRRLEDVFKTSWRRLQSSTFSSSKTSSKRFCKTSCNYVLETSSRRLGRQKNVTLKTSSRHLLYVFTKTNVCWVMTDYFWVSFDVGSLFTRILLAEVIERVVSLISLNKPYLKTFMDKFKHFTECLNKI